MQLHLKLRYPIYRKKAREKKKQKVVTEHGVDSNTATNQCRAFAASSSDNALIESAYSDGDIPVKVLNCLEK